MGYPTQGRRAFSEKLGQTAEQAFITMIQEAGRTATESSRKENIYDHIDVWVDGSIAVDVKNVKKEQHVFLELKNVSGNAGSMLGKADYMAFYFADRGQFVMTDRKLLLQWLRENVKNEQAPNAYSCNGRLFTRQGRKDLITSITYSQLVALPFAHTQMVTT